MSASSKLSTIDSKLSTLNSQLNCQTHPQPVFHKNFDLLITEFRRLQDEGYELYILADTAKQTDRLASIFADKETGIRFQPVNRTLHEGFIDDELKVCCFTDHQIFDRYHKYNLRTEQTRTGKVALTLKELQQFEIGDYVVHLDHGVGRFGGMVRIPNGDKMQEVIKIIYNHDDVVFVSIHALHKVSKYKGKEGEPPRISTLGTGAWEPAASCVGTNRGQGVHHPRRLRPEPRGGNRRRGAAPRRFYGQGRKRPGFHRRTRRSFR